MSAPDKVPASQERPHELVIGIADLLDRKTQLEEPELWLEVKDENGQSPPLAVKKKDGVDAIRQFSPVHPGGKYVVKAWRRRGGQDISFAPTVTVTVAVKEKHTALSITLSPLPKAKLLAADFVDAHDVLAKTPEAQTLQQTRLGGRKPREIVSYFGEGKRFERPHFFHERDELNKDSAKLSPVCYSRGAQAQLTVSFEVSLPLNSRAANVDVIAFRTGDYAKEIPINETIGPGGKKVIEATLKLPKRFTAEIRWIQESVRVGLRCEGHEIDCAARHLSFVCYTTFGRPRGQAVQMGLGAPAHIAHLEEGEEQSVTERRLQWALEKATTPVPNKDDPSGGSGPAEKLDEVEAMRRIFYGIAGGYYLQGLPKHISPRPSFHHFLWLSLDNKEIAECNGLAAAMRLAGRIIGIGGDMTVRYMFPYSPWAKAPTWQSDERRDLTKPGVPWQGAFVPDPSPMDDDLTVAFLDDGGYANNYEAVLRWKFDGRARSYPIGDKRVLDLYDATLSEHENDLRNIEWYFSETWPEVPSFDSAKCRSRFWLGYYVVSDDELRKPAHNCLEDKTQVRFKFQSTKSKTTSLDDNMQNTKL